MPFLFKVKASDRLSLTLGQEPLSWAVLLLAVNYNIPRLLTKVVEVEHQLIPHLGRQITKSRSRVYKSIIPGTTAINKVIIDRDSLYSELVARTIGVEHLKPHHILEVLLGVETSHVEKSAIFAKADGEHLLRDDSRVKHSLVDGSLILGTQAVAHA